MRRWQVRRAGGLAALAPLFSLAAQEQPVIRVNVNLVRVVTTVKTQSGELVKALQKEDFQIF